ncbi:MAG: hypothetical protein IMZ71_00210 [Chloroflexi bacterium]|nr:hypothetical protein [Chloroflexota bacterium]
MKTTMADPMDSVPDAISRGDVSGKERQVTIGASICIVSGGRERWFRTLNAEAALARIMARPVRRAVGVFVMSFDRQGCRQLREVVVRAGEMLT